MEKIQTLQEYEAASLKPGWQVMLWTAPWCPDCIYLHRFMEPITQEFKNMTFYEVNRDDLIDLAIDLKILGIPSFIVYRNGQEVGRFVSKLRKTKAEVVQFLKETLAKGE